MFELSERSFGIELEAHPVISIYKVADIIYKNSKYAVKKTDWQQSYNNDFWHVKKDATCGGGHKDGWEIASFKASGSGDLLEICKIVKILRKSGLQCGEDCGFHVHVDISDFSQQQAAILLAHWIKIENVVLKSVPKHRINNKFCKIISKKIKNKKIKYDPKVFWETYSPKNFSVHRNKDKKVTMNLVNYAKCIYYNEIPSLRSKRKTVEFRFPDATFNEKDVENWVVFFVNFVENIKNKNMPENLYCVKNKNQFFEISGLITNTDLCKWFLDRIEKFKSVSLKKSV